MRPIRCSFLLGLLSCALAANASVIVLEGNYQGKNLFVQNPFSEAGVGFCVYEVSVNNMVATDEINSNAFEVDMANFALKPGDKVTVKISHKDGCTPVVLNPEVLKPKSTFEVVNQEVTADGTFQWTTENETGELPFIVEQKRWNKWVKVGEVMGVGTPGPHRYDFKVTPHSGENTFRVRQTDLTRKSRYGQSINYSPTGVAVISWSPAKPKDLITFSGNTLYEIYDEYGNIVKRGFSNTVDIADLPKGTYYLNYDNKMGETFAKR